MATVHVHITICTCECTQLCAYGYHYVHVHIHNKPAYVQLRMVKLNDKMLVPFSKGIPE